MTVSNTVKNIKKRLKGRMTDYILAPYREILARINSLEEELQKKPDTELKNLSLELRNKVRTGTSPDDILEEAYALVREVCKRRLNMRPYNVQIITAIALHQGKLAEMKTGEGKTLAAVMPVYLNALGGKGIHVLTFNEYLAKRDADWMRPVYEFLGLSVAYISDHMSIDEKRSAYQCDITYATAKSVGFDFLRTFIAYKKEEIIQRPFHFAIVDEADALLIDEARNPLVLAGNISETDIDLPAVASFVADLKADEDYELDEYARNIFLKESGIKKAEQAFSTRSLHSKENNQLLSAINLAMHAKDLLNKDIDYVVKDGQVKLVDEFTGRIVADRKWQNGLQMAVEAKEKLDIQSEGMILGSISLPHFMQHYPKLSAMTATALVAAEEFYEFYKLDIVVIPPNLDCIRIDHPDLIFTHKEAKMKALVNEVIAVHQTGQPILIGTLTVKESETLAERFKRNDLLFEVLNAKKDEKEAEIIADAGKLGAITISTNMAGRGTDIILGGKDGRTRDQVITLGGLYVIGTNRHESSRIDDQLRGRAGRQGDPGSSRFFISFEDELMVRYKLTELFPKSYSVILQSGPIKNKLIARRIALAQKIVEGQMYEIRHTLYQYTTFIEKQRIVLQRERQDLLFNGPENEALKDYLLNLYDKYWAGHLDFSTGLRDGMYLERLGGRNPISEFHKKADKNYEAVQKVIDAAVSEALDKKDFKLDGKNIEKPSSTWTYVINDNPFGNQLVLMLGDNSNIAFQLDIFTLPLLFLMGLIRRIRHK